MQRSLTFFLQLFIAFATLHAPTGAQAQPAKDSHVDIQLLSEQAHIKSGQPFWVAIHQDIDEKWHTYWRYAGDSGQAPKVRWNLPAGFEAADLHWPVPKAIRVEPLMNYGYSDDIALLAKITPPDDLKAGKTYRIGAAIEILVCKVECIPEFGDYATQVKAVADNKSIRQQHSELFQATRARLPRTVDADMTYKGTDETIRLEVMLDDALGAAPDTLRFFPAQWDIIDNAGEQTISRDGDRLVFELPAGDRALSAIDKLRGVIGYEDDAGQRRGFHVTARPAESMAAAAPDGNAKNVTSAATETTTASAKSTIELGLARAVIYAILGGLILNLMPCVFPILSMKALSLVKVAQQSRARAAGLGLAYTAGVVLSFLAIAAVLLALKAGGTQVGWGFQLQNPVIVSALAVLLFTIGLNLSGMFDIGGGALGNIGQTLASRSGPTGAFFTGILATIVATPCTAPFMAAALGFALFQSYAVALAIFAALGFGLALPYLALGLIPALQRVMPRPGAWMETFRQALAFPMYASAIWLVWVATQQVGGMAVIAGLGAMLAVTLFVWLLQHNPASRIGRGIVTTLAIAVLIGGLAPIAGLSSINEQKQDARAVEGQNWQAYSRQKLDTALEGNKPVFVNMTADWCITCKVNERRALSTSQTRRLFDKHDVVYFKGDWTNRDSAITQYLNKHGRNGVPIYVYYAPPDSSGQRPEPEVMPQILSQTIIRDMLEKQAK